MSGIDEPGARFDLNDEATSRLGHTLSCDPHPGADRPGCTVSGSRGPPELREGQCAIVCAELSTGIILALTGEWATGDVDVWRVYPTAEEAESSARALVGRHPSWEAIVHNWRGDVVAIYRGELPPLARHEGWWKRWRRLLGR